jgi:hypothetical protein
LRPRVLVSDRRIRKPGKSRLFGRQLNFCSFIHSVGRKGYQGCSRKIRESHNRALAVIGVAIWIAIAELRPDLSQVARSDRLTTQRAKRLLSGRFVIH